MRCLNIEHDEFLVYDDKVAGFFNTYRSTGDKGIHRVENRKLSDEEIEKLKENIDDIDDIDLDMNEEDYDVINNIVKFYPEVRYFIHGLNIVEAKKPKRIVKKQEKRKKEELEKAKKEEPQGVKIETMPEEKRDPELERQLKEVDEKKKAEDDRQKNLEKSEKKLSEVGKKENPYGGFKGLLFDMFKKFEDPKTKAEKDRRLKEIREGWKFYEKNKKLLEQNTELVNSLHSLLQEGELTPQTVALMNELVARDKTWVKQIDFETERPPTISLPLDKFKSFIKDGTEIEVENQLKDLFKEEQIANIKLKVDPNKKLVNVTTDWNNAMKMIKIFNIKPKELKKPLTA